ncbi:MAG: ACT domain-containing protein [Oscillospiraceae bacterium]|nr:ACT domain-containing protein [Oscillospiraceae bacterium]
MSEQGKNWVVVDAAVLPEVITKTLTVKRMLANREERSSSAACRAAGISRSAFYKYRDSVFLYEEQMQARIFTVYLLLHDEAGVLSGVLHELSDAGANVLTLNQSIPVDGAATVTVTFRLQEAAGISALCTALSERKGVVEVRLLSGT